MQIADAFSETHLDVDSMDVDIEEVTRRLEEAVRDWEEVTNVTVELTLDASGVTAQIQGKRDEWAAAAKFAAEVSLDTAEASAQLDAAKIEWAEAARVEGAVDIDTETATAEITAAVSGWDDIAKVSASITVDAEPVTAEIIAARPEWEAAARIQASVSLDPGASTAEITAVADTWTSILHVTGNVDVNVLDATAAVSAAAAEWKDIANVTGTITIDTGPTFARIVEVRAALDSLDDTALTVAINVDDGDLATLSATLAAIDDQTATVAVTADTTSAEASIAELETALAAVPGDLTVTVRTSGVDEVTTELAAAVATWSDEARVAATVSFDPGVVTAEIETAAQEWQSAASVTASVSINPAAGTAEVTATAADWETILDVTGVVGVDAGAATTTVAATAEEWRSLLDVTGQVTIDTGTADERLSVLATLIGSLDDATVHVTVDGVDTAVADVEALRAVIVTLPAAEHVTVTAETTDATSRIGALIGAVDAVPFERTVTFTAATDQADAAVGELVAALGAVDRDVVVSVHLTDVAEVAAELAAASQEWDTQADIHASASFDPGEVTAEIAAVIPEWNTAATIQATINVDTATVTAELAAVGTEWDRLLTVNAVIGADTGAATTKVTATAEEWRNILDVSGTVHVDTGDSDTRVGALTALIDSLHDTTVRVTVDGTESAVADLTALDGFLSALPADEKVTITTNTADADVGLAGIAAALDVIPNDLTITVRTIAADAFAGLSAITAATDSVPRDITIRVTVDPDISGVAETVAALDVLPGDVTVHTDATLDAESVAAVTAGITAAVDTWDGLARVNVTTSVDTATATTELTAFADFAATLDGISPTISVTVDTGTSDSQIAALTAALSTLQDADVRVTVDGTESAVANLTELRTVLTAIPDTETVTVTAITSDAAVNLGVIAGLVEALPESNTITVTADTAEATVALVALQTLLANVCAGCDITITANTAEAETALAALLATIDAIPRDLNVTATTDVSTVGPVIAAAAEGWAKEADVAGKVTFDAAPATAELASAAAGWDDIADIAGKVTFNTVDPTAALAVAHADWEPLTHLHGTVDFDTNAASAKLAADTAALGESLKATPSVTPTVDTTGIPATAVPVTFIPPDSSAVTAAVTADAAEFAAILDIPAHIKPPTDAAEVTAGLEALAVGWQDILDVDAHVNVDKSDALTDAEKVKADIESIFANVKVVPGGSSHGTLSQHLAEGLSGSDAVNASFLDQLRAKAIQEFEANPLEFDIKTTFATKGLDEQVTALQSVVDHFAKDFDIRFTTNAPETAAILDHLGEQKEALLKPIRFAVEMDDSNAQIRLFDLEDQLHEIGKPVNIGATTHDVDEAIRDVELNLKRLELLTRDIHLDGDDAGLHGAIVEAQTEIEAFKRSLRLSLDVDNNQAIFHIGQVAAAAKELDTRVNIAVNDDTVNTIIASVQTRLDALKSEDVKIPVDMTKEEFDTKRFELQAEVDAIRKVISISAEMDTSKLVPQVAALQATLAELDGQTAHIGVDVNTGEATTKMGAFITTIASTRRAWEEAAKFDINPSLTTEQADTALVAAHGAWERIAQITGSVDLNSGLADEQIAELRALLTSIAHITVGVSVDSHEAIPQLTAIGALVETLNEKGIHIPATVSDEQTVTNLMRSIEGATDDAAKKTDSFGKSAEKAAGDATTGFRAFFKEIFDTPRRDVTIHANLDRGGILDSLTPDFIQKPLEKATSNALTSVAQFISRGKSLFTSLAADTQKIIGGLDEGTTQIAATIGRVPGALSSFGRDEASAFRALPGIVSDSATQIGQTFSRMTGEFAFVGDAARTVGRNLVDDLVPDAVENKFTSLFHTVESFFSRVGASIGSGLRTAVSAVGDFGSRALTLIATPFEKLGSLLSTAFSRAVTGLSAIGSVFGDLGSRAVSAFTGVFQGDGLVGRITRSITSGLSSVASFFGKLGSDAATFFSRGFSVIGGFLGDAGRTAGRLFSSAASSISGFFGRLGTDARAAVGVVGGFFSSIASIAAPVISALGSVASAVGSLFTPIVDVVKNVFTNVTEQVQQGAQDAVKVTEQIAEQTATAAASAAGGGEGEAVGGAESGGGGGGPFGAILGGLTSFSGIATKLGLYTTLAALATGVIGLSGAFLTLAGSVALSSGALLGLGVFLNKDLLLGVKDTFNQLKSGIAEIARPIAEDFLDKFTGPFVAGVTRLAQVAAPLAAGFIDPIASSFFNFLDQVTTALQGSGLFAQLGQGIAGVLNIFAAGIVPIEKIIESLSGPAFAAFDSIALVLTRVGTAFAGPFASLLNLITASAPVAAELFISINSVVGHLADSLSNVFQSSEMQGFISTLGQVLVIIGAIVGSSGFQHFMEFLISAFNGAVEAVTRFGQGVVAALSQVDFGPIIGDIKSVIGFLISAAPDIGSFIGTLIGSFVTIFDAAQTVIKDILDFILSAVDKVAGALASIASAASHIPGLGFLKGFSNDLRGFQQDVRGAKTSIDNFGTSADGTFDSFTKGTDKTNGFTKALRDLANGFAGAGAAATQAGDNVVTFGKDLPSAQAALENLDSAMNDSKLFDLGSNLKLDIPGAESLSSIIDSSTKQAKNTTLNASDTGGAFNIQNPSDDPNQPSKTVSAAADQIKAKGEQTARTLTSAILISIDNIRAQTRQATEVATLKGFGLDALANEIESLSTTQFEQIEKELAGLGPKALVALNSGVQQATDALDNAKIAAGFQKGLQDAKLKVEQANLVTFLDLSGFHELAAQALQAKPEDIPALETFLKSQGAAALRTMDDQFKFTRQQVANAKAANQAAIKAELSINDFDVALASLDATITPSPGEIGGVFKSQTGIDVVGQTASHQDAAVQRAAVRAATHAIPGDSPDSPAKPTAATQSAFEASGASAAVSFADGLAKNSKVAGDAAHKFILDTAVSFAEKMDVLDKQLASDGVNAASAFVQNFLVGVLFGVIGGGQALANGVQIGLAGPAGAALGASGAEAASLFVQPFVLGLLFGAVGAAGALVDGVRIGIPVAAITLAALGVALGSDLANAFMLAVTSKIGGIATTVAAQAAQQGVRIGAAIANGIVLGLAAAVPEVSAAANGIATVIETVIRTVLGVKSPSTVTTEIGHNVGHGLVVGMDRMTGNVSNAASNLAFAATPRVGPADLPVMSRAAVSESQASPTGTTIIVPAATAPAAGASMADNSEMVAELRNIHRELRNMDPTHFVVNGEPKEVPKSGRDLIRELQNIAHGRGGPS